MRRTLADSTFLRVYVLLALALLLIFGLALLGLAMVDQVRREQYRERLADAPTRLLTERIAELPDERREAWLAEQSQRLDMRLTLMSPEALSLDYFSRSRLDNGRPLVVSLEEEGWQLLRLLPGESQMLEVRLAQLSEHQLRGLIALYGAWLADAREPAMLERRLRLVADAGLPVSLSTQPMEPLDLRQRSRLNQGEVVLRLLPGRWSMAMYFQLPPSNGQPRWLSLGPVQAFEALPVSMLLLLLVVLLSVLAVIIYLIVRGVEARMARLELAATRIAGGRLDTRVKVESGDFLGRLGMAFNGMAAQVQSLLRGQQDMIRAVSHELRTPVARIRFAVQMVEDMTDDPAVRRQLQGVDGDIAELDDLIDEILTFARLGSESANGAELDTTLVECRAMVERVIEALRPLHAQREIVLATGPEVEAAVEPRYLQRAIQNLVANACRHARSKVMIRIEGEPRLVRFDIEDNGPGVPAASRTEIFKPFARLDDSRARRSGGYGLGLSIVQKVMAWHGGSVVVDDSPELGGARFTLLLPQRSRPREH